MATPSELLVQAADLIRDTAVMATDGPWEAGQRCVWERTSGIGVVTDGESGDGGCELSRDADWIALLNPAVAEPLEAWLRDAAESALEHHDGTIAFESLCGNEQKALAFAKALLGTPEETR